jgi:AT hook motif
MNKERVPTKLDEDQFLRRHQYCITMVDLERAVRDSNGYIPKGGLKAVCDHEEDGFCGASISPENLREVNARLLALAGAPTVTEVITEAPKRRRGRPRKAAAEAPSYFCVECNERHSLDNTSHIKFKRGRGRPRKS